LGGRKRGFLLVVKRNARPFGNKSTAPEENNRERRTKGEESSFEKVSRKVHDVKGVAYSRKFGGDLLRGNHS